MAKRKLADLFDISDKKIISEVENTSSRKHFSTFFEDYWNEFRLSSTNNFVKRILSIKNEEDRYEVLSRLLEIQWETLKSRRYHYIEVCAELNDVRALKMGAPYIINRGIDITPPDYSEILFNVISMGASPEIIEVLGSFGITAEKYLQPVPLIYLLKDKNIKSVAALVKAGGTISMTKDQEDILQYLRMHYGKSFIITEN